MIKNVSLLNTGSRTPLFITIDPRALYISRGHVDCANNLLNEHQAHTRVKDQQQLDVQDLIHGRHRPQTEEEKAEAEAIDTSSRDEEEPQTASMLENKKPLAIADRQKRDDDSESEVESER